MHLNEFEVSWNEFVRINEKSRGRGGSGGIEGGGVTHLLEIKRDTYGVSFLHFLGPVMAWDQF